MRVADGTFHLGNEPDAVSHARHWVADSLAGTPHADLVPDAELVVSELVTNAILHGSAPVTVRVAVGTSVRIEVGDGSRTAPVRARARTDAMTGRGLALVAALARDWGVESRPGGKVVWCELATGEAPAEADADTDIDALLAAWDDDPGGEPGGEERYTISLGDVRTDLLLGAKAHVDNLVREFTLAAHGADSGNTAAIPPQLAELFDAVVSRFAEARQSIKRQAIEAATRGDERTSLALTLPVSAAKAGEDYLAALDEIDAYARAARLLTLETPPQHRLFRRWYVESLVAQLRAASAGEQVEPVSFERRLLEELAVVEVARRGSDRAARLQHVTAALAAAVTVTDVGQVVVSEGVEALGASGGGLLLASEERLTVPATVGYSEPLVARLRAESRDDDLPAATALRTGESIWLESRDERDERFPALTGLEPGTVSMCAVPLVAGDHVLGALRFSFDVARLFDTDERRFVTTLAGQTAQALERAEAFAAARIANDKLAFLADASAALAESLDMNATLANVTRLAVPRLADWCAIHVLEDGVIRALAVAHADPAKVALAEEFQDRYPTDPDATTGVPNALRTGASELYPVVTDEMLVAGARDEEHLAAMRGLGFRSALVVALSARGRVFGTLTMVHAESERRYDQVDLALAEDLAHRAALAIDNANLYREVTDRRP
jgi:GAF domain-containing protein/anti-sigma regulatory factor (Ser/Thr protein kinase)